MREIKFRGWHIEDKVMYKSDEDHKVYLTFTANDGGQIFWEIYFDSSKRISYVDDRNGILMQYTGLKDKNGVEIYEGDICNIANLTDPSFRNEIVFAHSGFGYWCPGEQFVVLGNNYNLKWKDGQGELVKVIGNIYENPELLEPK